jgi:hypothetical protein
MKFVGERHHDKVLNKYSSRGLNLAGHRRLWQEEAEFVGNQNRGPEQSSPSVCFGSHLFCGRREKRGIEDEKAI